MNFESTCKDKDIDKRLIKVRKIIPIPMSIIIAILLFFLPLTINMLVGEFSNNVWEIMLKICFIIILIKLFLYIVVTKFIKIKKYDSNNKSNIMLLTSGLAKIQLLDNLIKYNDSNFLDYTTNGYVRFCEYFLKAGINPNVEDRNGQTALSLVSLQNKKFVPKIKKLILDSGANTNIRGVDGEYIFISDVFSNDISSVKSFIENGADINLKSLKGELPIYIAVSNGYENLVELLVNEGADTNINCTVDNSFNEDRLIFYAINKGNPAIIDIISKHSDIISAGSNGKTPLFYAIEKNKKDVVKVLLKYLTEKKLHIDKKINIINEIQQLSTMKYKEMPSMDLNLAVEILLREGLDEWLPKVQSILKGEAKLINKASGVLIGTEFDSIEYELREEKIDRKNNEETKESEKYIKELKEYVSKNYINKDETKHKWNKSCPVNSEKICCTNSYCKDGEVTCTECGGHGKVKCTVCGGNGKITCNECEGLGQANYYCPECKGTGILPFKVEEVDCPCIDDHSYRHDCLDCGGTGKDYKGNTCVYCKGYGYICSICNNNFNVDVYENEEHCKCKNHDKYEHLLRECKKCDGTGLYKDDICPDCKGRKIICQKCNNNGIVKNNFEKTCWNCHGTGVVKDMCRKCHGDTKVDCPSCDNGYVSCIKCDSTGSVNCSTCGGSGYLNRITYQYFSYKSISKYENNYNIMFDSNINLNILKCSSIDFYERLNSINNTEIFRYENSKIKLFPNHDIFNCEEFINTLSSFIIRVAHAEQNVLLERLNIIPAKYDIMWVENTEGSNDVIVFINNQLLMNVLI